MSSPASLLPAPTPPGFYVVLPYHSYTWIFAMTMIFAFLDAYAIGANDVANSFATSVGSRSLKLWQACLIACFTEFLGAFLLGAETTETVKDGIINTTSFLLRPDLLMSGFMCALISSSLWVMFATYMAWPVSTTHSIIGAIIGMGISAYGFGAVNWGWNNKGVAQIVTSWFLSPVLAGLIAAFVYLVTKYAVLKRKNSLQKGIWAIPFYFTITIFIVSYYVVSKNGASTLKITSKNGQLTVSGNVALCFGIIGAITGFVLIMCVGFLVPFFYRRLVKEEKLALWQFPFIWFIKEQPHDPMIDLYMKQLFTPDKLTLEEKKELGWDVKDEEEVGEENKNEPPPTKNPAILFYRKVRLLLYNSIFMDVATVQKDNKAAVTAHEVATVYDLKTEYLYSLLQVVTACFASFSHGSNDVANALGPLAAVYQVWETGTFVNQGGKSSSEVPKWMLAYAGFGIVCGLSLYGYNIMKTLGNNITFHSPSRGFSMELGAALAVITASFLGLPVSTTQCIVGATVAVGLCNGQLRAINWVQVAWCFFSWFLTLPVASVSAGCLYAFITRGPSFTLPPGM